MLRRQGAAAPVGERGEGLRVLAHRGATALVCEEDEGLRVPSHRAAAALVWKRDEGLLVLSHRGDAALVCKEDEGLRVLPHRRAIALVPLECARAHRGLRPHLMDLVALIRASGDSSGLQMTLGGIEGLGRCLPSWRLRARKAAKNASRVCSNKPRLLRPELSDGSGGTGQGRRGLFKASTGSW